MALSQQDLIAYLLLGKDRFFIDIGAGNSSGEPCASNTYWLFEKGWKGVLLDYDKRLIEEAGRLFRPELPCVWADITKINQKELYQKLNVPKVIDYLSIDVDDASLIALKQFPFDEYDFKFLTFEHDLYNPTNRGHKGPSMAFLLEKGYKLFAEDVPLVFASQNYLEDWYVNPKYYDSFHHDYEMDKIFYYRKNPNDIILDLIWKRTTVEV